MSDADPSKSSLDKTQIQSRDISSEPSNRRTSPVPSGRLSRFSKLGGLAAKLAGSAIANTTAQLVKAQKPTLNSTVLTQSNALAITQKLSELRGAAMKVGQMLSMDAGEFLPPEWEPILAQLRQGAESMPKAQLLSVLSQNWGKDWMNRFSHFSFEPVAAASIGQVHKATLKDGRIVAVKIQYPGVSGSINSDVDNVGRLLKLTGLAPTEMNLDALLADAKEQLQREADYLTESAFLKKYKDLLQHDSDFVIPDVIDEFTSEQILTMEYIESSPIESLANQSKETINRVCEKLMTLTLTELFDWGFAQSDPNLGNYRLQLPTSGENASAAKIVLLDFGACCDIEASTQTSYQKMALAMYEQSQSDIYEAFIELGLMRESMPDEVKDIICNAALTAGECIQTPEYNFKQSKLVQRLYEQTQGLVRNKKAVASPSFDTALINRKISGMILMANRFDATLPLQSMTLSFLKK